MCGIVGSISSNIVTNQHLLYGLKMLLNRGYDSVGLCAIKDNQFILHKHATENGIDPIDILESKIELYDNIVSPMIGHSRWASCGPRTSINAHPHVDYTGKFALVHNGIIENYEQIKAELISNGVSFKSETDSEVICNLISYYYHNEKVTVEQAMKYAFDRLEGTWGICLISLEQTDKLYLSRHGSPLLVGFGTNLMMVASEQSGFAKYVKNYVCLNDHDIVVLHSTNGKVTFDKKSNYELRKVTADLGNLTPAPHPHWTIKEIHEQADAIMRAIGMGSRIDENNTTVRLGGLNKHIEELKKIDNLILLGCGTSYHSGLYISSIFKEISGFNTVQVYDGAEFTKHDIPKTGTTALIFISQSGETKDLYRCIEIGKDNELLMIGVVNVVDSLIAREVHCGVYLNAGREVAVASTKAFTSQSVVLTMIAIWFAQIKNINTHKRNKLIMSLRRLPLDIKTIIEQSHEKCKHIAQLLLNYQSMFIIGKGMCDAIGQEGSLKIKEIGYIHSEAYSSSALKHGPFSLLGKNTPVIMLILNDEHFGKNQGVADEIKARESNIISIGDVCHDTKFDVSIKVPENECFKSLLTNVPMQLIAYELAILKKTNPDKPLNLAKVVTI